MHRFKEIYESQIDFFKVHTKIQQGENAEHQRQRNILIIAGKEGGVYPSICWENNFHLGIYL